jgi:hypothetical protein
MREKCRILVGKPKGKRSHGRKRHIWQDNIKIDAKEIGCGLDSSASVYVSATGLCEHSNEPSGLIKDGERVSTCKEGLCSQETIQKL